jgi:glucose-6-phosphate dehydrogenase assembly protein OpcA
VEETLMAATVSPDRILHELADLWVSLGKESETGAGVLRACSMTLIVLAEESEDVMGLGETIAALMPEHPARTIVVRLRGAGDRMLAERVYSQCWMPFGQRRQICCEQVEITASDSALGDLSPVILPLAVADLPVVVWCRSPRLAVMPEFREIGAMAHKIIVDSTGFSDVRAAIGKLSDWIGRGAMLGDLAWTRLTRWREMLSQVFENPARLAELAGTSRVRVTWSGPNEALARYMAAWVTGCLETAGVHADATVADGSDTSLRVLLEGSVLSLEMWREAERLVIRVNDKTNCTSLSQPTDYSLMREELGIMRRDPVFERVLQRARSNW